MTSIIASAFAIAVMAATPAHGAGEIVGRAHVVDGDTLDIGRERIRLWGVDAPESRQFCALPTGSSWRCGDDARTALARLTAGTTVRCLPQYRDRDGRQVARCSVNRTDLGEAMVSQGWALDYPHFSKGVFQAAERRARARRIGVWRGTLTPPWEWRAQQRRARAESDRAAGGRCRIKGNISAGGQRIAHAPGQRDYATVRIDAARGERWFCTMAAARAAGWRPPER